MKNINAFIKTPSGCTVTANAKVYNVKSDHPNYKEILEAVKAEEYDKIPELCDIKTKVSQFIGQSNDSGSKCKLEGNEITYNGIPVRNVIVDKIFALIKEDLPFQPMLNFLSKLMSNPSFRAINELYPFLEHGSLPITPEGNLLGYKSIRKDNECDWYTGKIKNNIGAELRCHRNEVDDDYEKGCSRGYHVGTLEYALGFNAGSNQKVVIVEVNPADVVSVPKDCDHQKVRTCAYRVVADYRAPLDKPVYNSDATVVESPKENTISPGAGTTLDQRDGDIKIESPSAETEKTKKAKHWWW